jgi:hypothetical protein
VLKDKKCRVEKNQRLNAYARKSTDFELIKASQGGTGMEY